MMRLAVVVLLILFALFVVPKIVVGLLELFF